MGPIEFGKRRIYFYIAAAASLFLLYNLFFVGGRNQGAVSTIPVLDKGTYNYPSEPSIPADEDAQWDDPPPPPPPSKNPEEPSVPDPTTAPTAKKADQHPVAKLMQEADAAWRLYEGSRSQSFRHTVETYRRKYGRHPPPGFKEWYMFARQRNVFNIDDFDQVMDDLRPFWAVEPSIIRSHAAHMWENPDFGASVIHVRDGKVARTSNPGQDPWRVNTMVTCIEKFVENLPDMDIAMNRLDQPRLLVPWEDLQEMLEKEYTSRAIPPEVSYNFTTIKPNMTDLTIDPEHPELDTSERLEAGWFGAPGKQYMDIASKACPPESPARTKMPIEEANAMYKDRLSGIVTNFNLSSDLCTVGPAIQDLHGMLYTASSIEASHKLVPIFSECKVNVNNDILFPANMYYRHDERYDYDPSEDVPWREKADTMIWRGVTSGGVQTESTWKTMHRQRLVQLANGTYMAETDRKVRVLAEEPTSDAENTTYRSNDHFQPSSFANQHTDIGFVEAWGCIPGDCPFYHDVFSFKPQTTLTSQFKSKYLIDVDGHSFSGRWHAFLQSRSLGFKATIFREWHDSRLFAWRHFVPLDNRYDDLYTLLTYFIGYGEPNREGFEHSDSMAQNPNVYIAPHSDEAKRIARQSREWATDVLRRDDIEVYMFRLLLEYGRLIDDNRDRIGYSGDGSELDQFDMGEDGAATRWGIGKSNGESSSTNSNGVP